MRDRAVNIAEHEYTNEYIASPVVVVSFTVSCLRWENLLISTSIDSASGCDSYITIFKIADNHEYCIERFIEDKEKKIDALKRMSVDMANDLVQFLLGSRIGRGSVLICGMNNLTPTIRIATIATNAATAARMATTGPNCSINPRRYIGAAIIMPATPITVSRIPKMNLALFICAHYRIMHIGLSIDWK